MDMLLNEINYGQILNASVSTAKIYPKATGLA